MEARKRRNKACTECRQQKLRCDASVDYSQPCSRCRLKSLDCFVSKSFQRQKRKTKAQLQEEVDRLREQMQGDATNEPEDFSTTPRPSLSRSSNYHESHEQPSSVAGSTLQITNQSPQEINHHSNGLDSLSVQVDHLTTVAQTLQGLDLDAHKIDDCFELFFKYYSPFLTLLDQRITPNQYHTDSPFLFWAIVITGARRYLEDPTILGLLIGRVIDLALSSLSSHDSPLQTITGLLILCNWTFPIDTVVKDLSHVFGGAAMQIAIQNGLHVFGNGQDFARTCLWPDASERSFRAQLWAYCLFTCQSTSFCDGLPPSMMVDAFDFDRKQKETLSALSPKLSILQKLHKIQTQGIGAIVRNGLNPESASDAGALSSLIDIFDFQLQELRGECIDQLDCVYLDCARLHIQAYHFFAKPNLIDLKDLVLLYSVARSVLDQVSSLDTSQDLALYSVQYIFRTVLLAAFSILKISRSDASQRIDAKGGEKSYFASIQFAKRRSLQNGDVDSKCSLILTQLWASKNVFRRRDGTYDSLRLRTRSRLSMGVVFDCFWWWRAEFGGQLNPYPDDGDLEEQSEPILSAFDYQHTSNSISGGVVPDWQWAAGITFPFETVLGIDANVPVDGEFLLPL